VTPSKLPPLPRALTWCDLPSLVLMRLLRPRCPAVRTLFQLATAPPSPPAGPTHTLPLLAWGERCLVACDPVRLREAAAYEHLRAEFVPTRVALARPCGLAARRLFP